MQDSLGLMQYHDQYLYGGSAANLPLQHQFLHHHQQQGFSHVAHEHLTGKDHAPEFADPAGSDQDLAVSGSEGGDDAAEVRNDGAGEERGQDEEEARGVRMIALLLECAAAVSVGNLTDANGMLLELSQAASPYASSCGERLVAYFARAMAARLMTSCLGVPTPPPPTLPCAAVHAAFRAFYNVAPFARSAFLACNQAVLDAVHGRRLVHVVDLDVVPGGALQWLQLLPALAARPGGPPALLRVTGFGASAAALRDTGTQLAGLARKLGLPFEFHAVAARPGDAVNAAAHVPGKRPGEAVAVHWTRHAMYDAAGDDAATLRLVRWLEPAVLTLVEQERGGGDGHGQFLDRFVSALHHYSALFDAVGAARPAGEDASRHLAEDGVLGREITGVLALGGLARARRFGCWQTELARLGFLRIGSSGRAQMVAAACPAGLGYTVADDLDGTVRLGWKGTPLYAVSTWTWCPARRHSTHSANHTG